MDRTERKAYTTTIRSALGKGASLIAMVTPDQPGALRALASALPATVGLYSWDVVRGLSAVNDRARADIALIESPPDGAPGVDPSSIVSLTDLSLVAVQALPPRSVVFCFNAHAPLSEGGASGARSVQACLNLRDPFGASTRALILACPAWPAPVELGSDVLVITDEPPADDTRRALVRETVRSAVASGATISDVDGAVESATRATRGLSGYAVAQAVALSVGATGVDSETLQSRFVSAINAKPGLRYQPADVTLKDVAGLANMKEFAQALASAREKPGAIVFIDEIEKAIAGSSGQAADSSGASQAILGAILTWMQDSGASGMIALGPPGAGKSLSAKALGSVVGVPTIALDLGALKGSLVGQTEAQTRAALSTITALAGKVFVVATCNSEASLPPELRRRFKQGIWFFDLPTSEERAAIWELYLKRYDELPEQPIPASDGWTGAEIASCCESAWSFRITLAKAAQWIVPVAQSAADVIRSLRKNASGRYISASAPGAYVYSEVTAAAPKADVSRSFTFDLEEK